jgi:structural maintenance of chromosome 1
MQDIFYEKADALVGVARDVELSCSKTFTFDLSAFGEPQDAE